jgi:hypothetical protein
MITGTTNPGPKKDPTKEKHTQDRLEDGRDNN